MKFRNVAAVSLIAIAAAGGAMAGGYTPPVQEIVVAPITQVTPTADWAGAYGGASLGYSFGGDDRVGFDYYEGGEMIGRSGEVTNLKVKGITGGIHAGYRWQRDNWVFGPQIGLEGGSVDAENTVSVVDEDGTDQLTLKSEVNYIATLTFQTGYLVDPQTMIYGNSGIAHGDFDYSISGPTGGATEGYSATGYVLGLGVERKLSDRASVFAEWQYRNFSRTDVTFVDGTNSAVTVATPEHHNIKVGVNFSF